MRAIACVKLKDWDLRDRPELRVGPVAGRAMREFSQIRNAMVFAFSPPAVVELGMAKGFDFQLLDRGGMGHEALMNARNQLLGMAAKDPALTKVRPTAEDVPEYRIEGIGIRRGAERPNASINNTISTSFAALTSTISSGRPRERVYARRTPPTECCRNDMKKLHERNSAGNKVPFSSFATGRWTSGSPKLRDSTGFPPQYRGRNCAAGVPGGNESDGDFDRKLPPELL